MKKLTVEDFNQFGELKVAIIKKQQKELNKQNNENKKHSTSTTLDLRKGGNKSSRH